MPHAASDPHELYDIDRAPLDLLRPLPLRIVFASFFDSEASGALFFCVEFCDPLVWRENEAGSPLRLRRGIRLWLPRSELALWLADEILLANCCCLGSSQGSSLRPCSQGATFVVIAVAAKQSPNIAYFLASGQAHIVSVMTVVKSARLFRRSPISRVAAGGVCDSQ